MAPGGGGVAAVEERVGGVGDTGDVGEDDLGGGMAGGALTDRFGRKKLILIGLVFSAVSTLSFGLVSDIRFMYPLAAFVGLLGSISGPAHNAMIADILPEEKRQEGFGILRVVGNFAWIIGPSIGGLVAKYNFFSSS